MPSGATPAAVADSAEMPTRIPAGRDVDAAVFENTLASRMSLTASRKIVSDDDLQIAGLA